MATNNTKLIDPCGGKLVDLTVPFEAYSGLKAYASQLPSIQISPRSACDLELIATGALSPLDRFMGREDYHRVLEEMRLTSGPFFPIPVTLPVEAIPDLHLDRDIALRNNEYELLAVLTVDEIYQWDRFEFAEQVYEMHDLHQPAVFELQRWGSLNISGRLQTIHIPGHFDFPELYHKPFEMRARLADMERHNVIAYQLSGSIPCFDDQLFEKTLEDLDGSLLMYLAVGLARLGDIRHFNRIRLYKELLKRFSKSDRVMFSLLPLVNHMIGPRETLWQALISRNYGANHMIVSCDLTGNGNVSGKNGNNHRNLEQDLVDQCSQELGINLVPIQNELANIPRGLEQFAPPSNARLQRVARRRNNGHKASASRGKKNLTELLAESYPPRHKQGVCIWFTGLSGSGKSTTAEVLTWLLLSYDRQVTVLDGDVVRTHLSKGLGFSREDRDTNVRRIGFVASELVRIGGVVICAVVSPYRAVRNDVRQLIGDDQFVEVFVNTPLVICEARDVKGMYARARRGGVIGFTGIDDPYEPPLNPEITLDTVNNSPQENSRRIINVLIGKGFIRVRTNKVLRNMRIHDHVN